MSACTVQPIAKWKMKIVYIFLVLVGKHEWSNCIELLNAVSPFPSLGNQDSNHVLLGEDVMRNILLFLSISILAGCGSTSLSQFSAEPLGPMPRKVAVFPLMNLTTHPYAGQIVGELLFTELKNIPKFSVMNNTESWKAFQGKETDVEEAALHQNVRQTALQLGLDAVFFGSVTEYRYKRGIDEDPVVGVTIRLMDVATGNILWGASLSKAGGCCSFGGDSLSSTAQKVCKDLVNNLLKDSSREAAHKIAAAG